MKLKSMNDNKELWPSLASQVESLEKREEFACGQLCCFQLCCFEICCFQLGFE